MKRKITEFHKNLTQTQFIAFGFFCMILAGTLLLMLPAASRDGHSAGFLNSLFTATSASCVTGLVVADTYQQWSMFGRFVIITLIQIGGLGFVTIGVLIAIVFRRKIGLKTRGLIQESMNTLKIGGVVKLTRKILIGSVLIEGIGAMLLAVRFIPQFGLVNGVGYSIFHSISAFCNAGFDLMGGETAYVSLTVYYDDWLVNLVIMALIVIGGIGFVVWDDVSTHKLHVHKYMLHTKLVLIVTAVLVFGGAALFYVQENNLLFRDMTTSGKILSSLFSSVTARTAGFNTVDTAALTDGSKLLTIILMFIGGSPGSTAGGVKTTTIIVLLFFVRSTVGRTYGVNVFKRRLEDDSVKRASAIFCINLSLAVSASLAIMMLQPVALADVLFETFSAIGTVGMTTGITRDLLPVSRLILVLLMYCGRIGSLSFALSFTQQKKIAHVQQPVERIIIG